MTDLSGRIALITGGASGIGLAMAKRFAGAGMRIALADVEKDALDRAAAELPLETKHRAGLFTV